jgi:hypothetical protein
MQFDLLLEFLRFISGFVICVYISTSIYDISKTNTIIIQSKETLTVLQLWLVVPHIAMISTALQSMMLHISHTKPMRHKINHFDSNEN